jgi:hypothetical protein
LAREQQAEAAQLDAAIAANLQELGVWSVAVSGSPATPLSGGEHEVCDLQDWKNAPWHRDGDVASG